MTGKYGLRLIGTLTGPIRWPAGEVATKTIDVDLVREAGRMDNPTMRDLILHVISEHGGDFQYCHLDTNAVIEITRATGKDGRRTVRAREWTITAFRSIQDAVGTAEWPDN